MDRLLKEDYVCGIPYEHYFMSCNLDHVLYDEQNLEADKKEEYASIFAKMFSDKERDFPLFLKAECVCDTPEDMKKSWEYIKTGVHSLERHTNLHVYFKLHPVM